MKERVGRIVDRGKARGLIVSTFHNLGLNIIRDEHQHLGYHPGFSIFDAEDAKALLQDLMMREADRKSTRLNSSHVRISYAVFCLKKKKRIPPRSSTPR